MITIKQAANQILRTPQLPGDFEFLFLCARININQSLHLFNFLKWGNSRWSYYLEYNKVTIKLRFQRSYALLMFLCTS